MTLNRQTGVRVNELLCPACKSKGRASAERWQCGSCEADFRFRVLCDVCDGEVDRIRACGGFEEYYCNSCRVPKSKFKVIFEFTD